VQLWSPSKTMRGGKVLSGRYELEREIGKGGMGVVWAAYDHQREQRVAVKVIIAEENEAISKQLRQRLAREFGACVKLDHPNVVRVYDFGETDRGEPYLVLELLDGQTVSQYIEKHRRIKPKEAARIAAEAASGLAAVHDAKVIHRDFKPANIFLHREPGMLDDDFTTKVLDFGVCKDPDSVEVARTKTGMIVGSVAYMSPEQIMRPREIDGRADIWSLGVVLYEMLTGMRAFTGTLENVLAQLIKIPAPGNKASPVPPPSTRVRDVPAELDVIVARCTAPLRRDRYVDANELARELYAVAGIRPPAPQRSASRPSIVEDLDLLNMFDVAIQESNAVPNAGEERRFNPAARTLQLGPRARPVAPPPTVDDESDAAVTLEMPAKKLPHVPRPPALVEPGSARDAAGTQLLETDASIPSPAPEWKRAIAEHREASQAYPIAELLRASNGETQMIEPNVGLLETARVEPSVTTSTVSAMSQEVATKIPKEPLPAPVAASARPRQTRMMVYLSGALLIVAAAVMVAVVTRQQGPEVAGPNPVDKGPERAPTPPPSAAPTPTPTAPPQPAVSAAPSATAAPETAPPKAAPSVLAPTVPVKAPTPGPKPMPKKETGTVKQPCKIDLFHRCKNG
jgi:eukaryotic-like serine/threonine-protein kinase